MSLQQQIFPTQGTGVVGSFWNNAPGQPRTETYSLNSLDPANNVFGRVFTKSTANQGYAQAGGDPALFPFAGFMVNPKLNASFGTVVGGPLAPTLTVPNQTIVEITSFATIIVSLPAPANIGDYIYYDILTGELTSQPPLSVPLVGTAFANAVVDYFTVTSAGLAIITISDTPVHV